MDDLELDDYGDLGLDEYDDLGLDDYDDLVEELKGEVGVQKTKPKSIIDILSEVLGDDSEDELAEEDIGEELLDNPTDLQQYEYPLMSDKQDIQKGIGEMRSEHKLNVDEDWNIDPSKRILTKNPDDNEDVQLVQYPLILINIETVVMQHTVRKIMKESGGKLPVHVHLNIDGTAEYQGKVFMDHKTFKKFERLGIQPIYYKEKGVIEKFNSETLFDPIIYNERILMEDPIVEAKDPMADLVPDKIYESKIDNVNEEVVPEPDIGSPMEVDLEWMASLSIEDEPVEEQKDLIPDKIKNMELDWN